MLVLRAFFEEANCENDINNSLKIKDVGTGIRNDFYDVYNIILKIKFNSFLFDTFKINIFL